MSVLADVFLTTLTIDAREKTSAEASLNEFRERLITDH